MKTAFVICTFLSANVPAVAQANLFPAYTQNFGTTDISGTWTDNSTFPGWYCNKTSINHQDVTASLPSNTGALYSYECNGNNDEKIGSRASGGTGTVRFGVRLVNNTATTINFIRVTFDAFQFSLADDCGTQTLSFSYLVGATSNNINAGGFINVAALNFTALQTNGGSCGSTQLSSFPCTQTTNISSCIAVTIPPGNEIMLKWEDIDDSGNDHHMAIDNVNVVAYSNNAINPSNICISPLPVELINFDIECNNREITGTWSTASEINNESFGLEGSKDAVQFEEIGSVEGNGNSNSFQAYTYSFYNTWQYNYFRLTQTDFNGIKTYFDPHFVECVTNEELTVYYSNEHFTILLPSNLSGTIQLSLTDLTGKTLYNKCLSQIESGEPLYIHPETSLSTGVYFIQIHDLEKAKSQVCKIFIQS